ncbi:MAG: NAD(P)/FAD-dependent oxidoreductase [Bacteroidales bacterium]|nr:NAD(P)/FAD-dependent oxidoreductase [Bacteroidales bacterium]
MKREIEITIPPIDFSDSENCIAHIAKALHQSKDSIKDFKILRRSIDARKTPLIRLRLIVSDKEIINERKYPTNYQYVDSKRQVIIIGAGPAGLFAALRLIEHGIKPVIVEKGQPVEQRKISIANIIRTQTLNQSSNWCFGEGGAGTFSDGKLFSRSNKRGCIAKVLETFVEHGACNDILFDSHPHIGTDNLSRVIKNIRQTIEHYGGEYRFDTSMKDLIISNNQIIGIKTHSGETLTCNNIILACGHSSKENYDILLKHNIKMASKPFALGVRVEHSQAQINEMQYHSTKPNIYLPPASYQLAHTTNEGGVFSFCMCPGGIVIPASTKERHTVVNGMSNSLRNSPYANAGIVVSVNESDVAKFYRTDMKKDDPLFLLSFQQDVEARAYAGKIQAYGQRLTDFLTDTTSQSLNPSSYLGSLVCSNLNQILPSFVCQRLNEGFRQFNRRMNGFITQNATLIGVESRTSSPVRILRDDITLASLSVSGLYPCGEGAGYAGGITSSAIDGINVADSIAKC